MYFDFIIASFSVILCSFPIILMNTIKIARKKQVTRAVVIYIWSRIDYYDHMRWLRWYLARGSVGQECKSKICRLNRVYAFNYLSWNAIEVITSMAQLKNAEAREKLTQMLDEELPGAEELMTIIEQSLQPR